MRTEQLVELLAHQAGPAPRHLVLTRLLGALVVGMFAGMLLAWWSLGGQMPVVLASDGALGLKVAFAAAMALASGRLVAALARPGTPFRARERMVLGVLLGMTALAGALCAVSQSAPGAAQFFAGPWKSCPWSIAALSMPALAAMFWALRGLAPTQPRRSGFAAGLLAGAVGALIYALYCPTRSPWFVVTWYTLGMLLPALLGSLLGPRLLRW